MADAAVSFAIETLGNFLIQETVFLSGVREQVEEMRIELDWMQCFLKDAERRKGESHRVRNWVSEIRDAAYDVEDLVESFILKSAQRNGKGVVSRIKKYACCINHVAELHQLGSGIEAIKARLTNLRTRLQVYGVTELRVGGEDAAATTSRRRRQDYAHIVDHNVVGLDEKITELVERLIDGQRTSMVCIYGMGGLGKTTTAKQVYNDNRTKAHFEVFAWAYVSQQFTPRKVWETILAQLSDKKIEPKALSEDELTSQLCRLQKVKKCLLVLDDIWEARDWDKLSAAFPYLDADYRSKILFTTRNKRVASHGVYHSSLNVLDFNNSFKLLKNTIMFLGGPDHPIEDNSDMEKYAKEMVRECAGLPLAITVLGGVLATKDELRDWERVGDNIRSYLNTGGQGKNNDGVASVLESSYDDLPYHLKTCFLYFSQYPEDEEINTNELIQKWIGEGFVSSSMEREGLKMEEIAEEYMNELVSRCMVQAGSIGHTRRVKTCRVHDLMRDFCISKAKEERFSQSVKLDGTNLDNVSSRRICVLSGNHVNESILSSLIAISPNLRSVWFRGEVDKEQEQDKAVSSILKRLKLVRVLELVQTSPKDLSMVANLVHVRFLKLVTSQLNTSICNLKCLETLNLESCGWIKIPDSIWGMEQLRHLYLPLYCSCESNEQPVVTLPNLQTLVNFPPPMFDLKQNLVKLRSVRKLAIRQSIGEICEISRSQEIVFNRLQSLSFLHTKYHITDLEAMTRGAPRLCRLFLDAPLTFQAAVWPSSLTKVELTYTNLDVSHMQALAELQSLKALSLHVCSILVEEVIFHEGDFPCLRHLLFDALRVETWIFHQGAAPSLCCLEINSCTGLKSVPDGTQFLKQLKEIKVRYMPYSFVKKMERGGDDWDMVSHVPSISFYNCEAGE